MPQQLKKRETKTFIILFLLCASTDGIFLILLKLLRFLFPPSIIGTDKIIGYVQYNGYPFYFDTIIFLLFLIIPLGILLAAKHILPK